ncbi:MAG: hypothetical protein ACI9NT_001250 [Bacteroidia bacterium]
MSDINLGRCLTRASDNPVASNASSEVPVTSAAAMVVVQDRTLPSQIFLSQL